MSGAAYDSAMTIGKLSRRDAIIVLGTSVAAGTLAGCGGEEAPAATVVTFSFATDQDGWEVLYSDYILGMEPIIEFSADVESLPGPLGPAKGFKMTSINRSDDLWMCIFARVPNLLPHQRYKVDMSVTMAVNGGTGCWGAGGIPGAGVTVKAGAVSARPATVMQADNYVAVNFDKGNQTVGSAGVPVIGDLSSSSTVCTDSPYEIKTLATPAAGAVASADANGDLWLVVGTDSGYEGLTTLYYTRGTATLTAV